MQMEEQRAQALQGPGRGYLIGLAIALLTIGVFAKSLGGKFIDDDLLLVAQSPALKSLSGLPHLLTRPMWSDLSAFAGDAQIGHFRPLTSLVFALGFGLGGGPDSPWVFHLLSLLIHVVAALAAFHLARQLLGSELAGAGAALIFALHPIQVESIAWTSAMATPLLGALALLAMSAWHTWRMRGSKGLPWLAAGLALAALLANEAALAIFPILYILDRFQARTLGDSTCASTNGTRHPWALMLGVVALWFGIRVLVFGETAAALGRVNADFGGSIWRARAELFGGGVWHLFLPTDISIGEPFREAWPGGSAEARNKTIGLLLFVAILSASLLGFVRANQPRKNIILAASLGILAAVSPAVIGILGLGQTPFSGRHWYLATFFFALLVMATVQRFSGYRKHPIRVVLSALLLSAWYGVRDSAAQAAWSSPESFYRTAIERYRDVPRNYWNLGEILRSRFIQSLTSNKTIDVDLLNEAFAQYEQSSTLLARANTDNTIPKGELDYLRTGVGQAWCYLLQAEVDEYHDFDTPKRILELLLEQVQRREAGNRASGGKRARLPIEEVLTTLGTVELRAKDSTSAEGHFRRALEINPNYLPALRNLATLRFQAGQFALSSKLLWQALKLSPKQPALLELYSQSLFQEGWSERALEISAELEQAQPSNPTPEILRGLTTLKQRDFEIALDHFDRAISRSPHSSVALFQRGMTLYQMGEVDLAITALRRACEQDTEDFTAHYNLASVLFERGAAETAQPYLERAYAVGSGRSELHTMRMSLLQLDPDNAPRMRAFAELDDLRADTKGALFWTERAIAIDPDNGRSRHLMGRLLLNAKEPILAQAELLLATQLLPNSYISFLDLGRCYAELGIYDQARTTYNHAHDLVAAQKGPVGPNISEQAVAGFEILRKQLFEQIEAELSSLP